MKKHRTSILVVDDTISNIEVLAHGLGTDYDISIATSGQGALDLLEQYELPDLILLDVVMPGMDGYEVIQALKKSARLVDIPVIFLTAMSDSESESKALSTGAADFIHKPINLDVVKARVALQLRLAQQRIELGTLNQRLSRSLQEITEAQRELQVFAKALECSPTSILILDRQGGVEYANPYFQRHSGYTQGDLKGRSIRQMGSGPSTLEALEKMWGALSCGEDWSGEIIGRSKEGRLYREEVHAAPVVDASGDISRYVAIQLDITERFEAQQAVIRARQRELEVSAGIQQQLLFGDLPRNLPAFAVACRTEPSQVVDGDFYTFTTLGPTRFEVLVGDVMGKGVSAALVGAGIKNAYREAFNDLLIAAPDHSIPSPATLINAVHAKVSEYLISSNLFVTLCLLRFDYLTSELTSVNAGNGPVLIARQQGDVIFLNGDNVPLGVLQDEVYVEQVVPFMPGDQVLLFSDGLSEASNPAKEQFGLERISAAFEHCTRAGMDPQSTLADLRELLNEFIEGTPLNDDVSMIAVRSNVG